MGAIIWVYPGSFLLPVLGCLAGNTFHDISLHPFLLKRSSLHLPTRSPKRRWLPIPASWHCRAATAPVSTQKLTRSQRAIALCPGLALSSCGVTCSHIQLLQLAPLWHYLHDALPFGHQKPAIGLVSYGTVQHPTLGSIHRLHALKVSKIYQ